MLEREKKKKDVVVIGTRGNQCMANVQAKVF